MLDEDDLPLANYIAVVLAGGEGARMGRNKLLMEISARPMIRHVVETIRGVFQDVIVVTGYQKERVEETLARSPVEFVDSPPSEGQAAAIDAAFARAKTLPSYGACEGIVLCIGDQPRLTEREIVGLIEVFKAGDKRKALVPMREVRRGYPVIVPPDFDTSRVDLSSESVARDNPDHVMVFPTKNPVYDSSVDTPEDYRAFFAI
jgi:CTP:molybdopterin cytidylyltransferase MocA